MKITYDTSFQDHIVFNDYFFTKSNIFIEFSLKFYITQFLLMSLGFFVILSLLAYPFKNDIPNLLDYQLYFFFPATILSGIYLWRYPALIRKQALQVLIKLRNKFPEYLQNSKDTLEISQNCLIHSYAGFSGSYDFSKILRIDDYLTYTFIFTHPNMAIVIPHHKVHGDGLENFLNELKQKFEASR